MGTCRKDYFSCKHGERGIALVTTLIIAVATIMFLTGVYYILKGGLETSHTRKQYTSIQEVTFNGIVHGIDIFKNVVSSEGQMDDVLKAHMGLPDDIDEKLFPCGSYELSSKNAITLASSDRGQIETDITIQCLDYGPIPGYSTVMDFPTPPLSEDNKRFYAYLDVRSHSGIRDAKNPITSYMDAIYRQAF